MAAFLSKYGVARHIFIPMVKRGVVDFAISTDWTPAAGDVKISKDGGAFANVTNLPTATNSANTGAQWDFSLTATEMQAAQVTIAISDATAKVVEDQFIYIETYGNASAQHALDLATATVNPGAGGITSSSFAAGALNAAAINADTGLKIRTGTAQAGAASTITLDAGASAVDNFYVGEYVLITGGTGAAQVRLITGYVGSTKVATVAAAWATNPDNTSTFALGPARTLTDSMRATVIAAAAFATDAVDANALKADAASEIAAAVWATAMSDIAAVPGITASALSALNWLFVLARNKRTQTATTETVLKDDSATSLSTSTKSDDGTTMTRGKYV